MKTTTARPATVPVSYVQLMLELAAERGVNLAPLLSGLGIPQDLTEHPDGRVNLRPDYAELCRRALRMTREPALGYEFGLRATLTTHGIVGYGLMSQANLRQVLDFAKQFGSELNLAAWRLHFEVDHQHIRMKALDSLPPTDLRPFSAQQLIIGCYSLMAQLLPPCRQDMVLCFDFAQPPFHSRYARRLPTCHFNAPFNELRLPIHYLDKPIHTGNLLSARLAERECVKALSMIEHLPHVAQIRQVRTLLTLTPTGYLSAEDLAAKMCLSVRSLRRHMHDHGTSYRALRQEAQHRDSLTLLQDQRLSIGHIAERLGYSTVANFCRAFRSRHGVTPSQWRASAQQRKTPIA